MSRAPTCISDDVVLQDLAARFDRVAPGTRSRCTDGMWTCDGGAAIAAHLADAHAIPRRLRSGFFWHDSVEAYNATMGYAEGSADWATWRDEAHCWVELDRPYGVVILDPNGERVQPDPKPRLALYDPDTGETLDETTGAWAPGGYEPVNADRDCINYDEDENIPALAADSAFGLADTFAAVQADLERNPPTAAV